MLITNLDNNNKTGITVICIAIATISIWYSYRNTDLSLSSKKAIWIRLEKAPQKETFRSVMKFYEELALRAENEPLKYKIENFEFKACDYQALIDKLVAGDSVQIWIDYENTLERKFLGIIRVYQLSYESIKYVDIDYRNLLRRRNNKWGLFVGAFCILMEIVLFQRGRKVTLRHLAVLFLILIVGMYRLTN